ncbi:MAG: hypothetical protein E6Q97_17390 [Desulfurellales bacterium]|nr:MAG: hypothetical protein E6Q97_17390 [Desulfurellales bacterium]
MRKTTFLALPFPIRGLDETTAKRDQPPNTTRDVSNMRPFDPFSGRARGGQRGGISKFNGSVVGSSNRIQDLNHITTVSTAADSQSQTSIRTVTGVAICDGDVYRFTTSVMAAVTNGTNACNASAPVIFSAQLFGKLYIADGVNYKYYDVATDAVAAWTATSGTLPINGSDTPRLIEVWRGRVVMSGIKSDPHNWFMSAQADAHDWDYNPNPVVETQAVAGNNSPAGLIGEPITAIIPFSEDVLLFGSDHSLWQMDGDPAAGGRIIRLSGITGVAWGRAWCTDPNGVLYFFGARGGVYRLSGGQTLERISAKRIDARLARVNLNTSLVRLAWNDAEMGVHVFITPLTNLPADHYFYDARTDSWWMDQFSNTSHSPVSVHSFDGDDPDDRVLLLGGQDGYIRKWTQTGLTDDGTAVSSSVVIGPIQPSEDQEGLPFLLTELQVTLAEDSGSVTCEVFIGDSAEDALAVYRRRSGYWLTEGGDRYLLEDGSGFWLLETDESDFTATFDPITSIVANPRLRAYAAYVKLSQDTNNEMWAMEDLQARVCVISTSLRRRF